MKISSTELQRLVVAVHDAIIEQPTDRGRLYSSIEDLLSFLTTPAGRTDQNCQETDKYFLLHEDNGFTWGHLPEEYQLILDDIGGQLHDTVMSPNIASNFESTPEQLLDRVRKLKNK
jgi:hypothetical protein